MLAML